MTVNNEEFLPIYFIEGSYSKHDLDLFIRNHPNSSVVDQFELQMAELFEIVRPDLKNSPQYEQEKKLFFQQKTSGNAQLSGSWVYFPWRNALVHILNEVDFFQVRTNRNKLLINTEEQMALRKFSIGFVGLSIGGVMAQTMLRMGFSNQMKLLDFDTVSLSNLNRLSHGVLSLGGEKTIEIARSLYEIDPYVHLHLGREKLSTAFIQEFISESFVPDLLIDAIDDFPMKVKLRMAARQRGIPVVMLTSLGDRLLVDIERYDLDRNYPLFHGLVNEVVDEILDGQPVTVERMKKFSVQLVGKNNVPKRAIASLVQLNRTLVGRPQLYATVLFGAATLSKIVRKIALKKQCQSGRYVRKLV